MARLFRKMLPSLRVQLLQTRQGSSLQLSDLLYLLGSPSGVSIPDSTWDAILGIPT